MNSSGDSGHNVEYVLKLAEWMRAKLPDIHDPHLFTLEELIRAKVEERKLDMRKLMGEAPLEEEELQVEEASEEGESGNAGIIIPRPIHNPICPIRHIHPYQSYKNRQ